MQIEQNISERAFPRINLKDRLTAAAIIFLFLILLIGANEGTAYIKNALSLCFSSVIPSTFPIMVVSGMIASGNGAKLISRIFGGILSRIFGTRREASAAIILGFICGFPVGAAVASKLYERGAICKDELSFLLTFVNNPSAAFVIYAVGSGVLGSTQLGVIIYASVVISAVTAALLFRFIMHPRASNTKSATAISPSLAELTVSSVSSAISGTLNVCAYSSFFSATVGIASSILMKFGYPFQLRAALFGIFEIISGISILSESGCALFAVLSSAAVCAWSGVSVIMQIVAVCRRSLGEDRLSFLPMVISKCFQATLCPIIVFLLLKLTHFDI